MSNRLKTKLIKKKHSKKQKIVFFRLHSSYDERTRINCFCNITCVKVNANIGQNSNAICRHIVLIYF